MIAKRVGIGIGIGIGVGIGIGSSFRWSFCNAASVGVFTSSFAIVAIVSSFVAARRVSILARASIADEGWRREWYGIHKMNAAIRVNLAERVTPGF